MTLMTLMTHRADDRRAAQELGVHLPDTVAALDSPSGACTAKAGHHPFDLHHSLFHDLFSDSVKTAHLPIVL